MIVFQKGAYWVEHSEEGFTVCNNEGCSDELYHVGDTYPTEEEAKADAIFFEEGGHWMDRPRNSLYP